MASSVINAKAKLFKVTHKAIHDWVKAFAKSNSVKPEPQGGAVIVELDEMWHFIGSKKTNCGYGKLIVAIPVSLSTGSVANEITLHLQNFMDV
jgi:transposase